MTVSTGLKFHSDEPTAIDKLNRAQYAAAFAELSGTCDTPLTIGIYASWGVGKTSLMKQIHSGLSDDAFHKVWFNAWEHQAVDEPVLALAHVLADGIENSVTGEVKKLLSLIAAGLGAQVLRVTTGMKLREMFDLGKSYEEERFQNVDVSIKLKIHIKDLVSKVTKVSQPKRLVIFVDDLDRCSSEQSLKILEALKLYFNINDCIFFIGVDREALQEGIRNKYSNRPLDEVNYLDKIIQLPFTVPLIEPDQLTKFVKSLLPEELVGCQEILQLALGGNPRQVKRFINNLQLNHNLAKSMSDYNAIQLCGLLLLQYRKPSLYSEISVQHELLDNLIQSGPEGDGLRTDYFGDDFTLEKIIKSANLNSEVLPRYLYFTNVTGTEDVFEENFDKKFTGFSEMPVQTIEFLSRKEIPVFLKERVFIEGEELVDAVLIFRTKGQRTWIAVSNRKIYCLLDDEKTRAKESVLQWQQSITVNMKVKARVSSKRNHVLDIGIKSGWLYSQRLHPDPKALEETIKSMLSLRQTNA